MYRINKERIKSYILVVLILTAITQVGFLWNNESQGFPIGFLLSVFNGNGSAVSDSEQTLKQELYKPVRVVVSNGEGEHCLIDRNSDIYNLLWEDAQTCIKNILKQKPSENFPYKVMMEELIHKRVFIYSFATNTNTSIIKWFNDMRDTEETSFTGVYKIIISPWDDVNINMNTIYIADDTKIFKYNVSFSKGEIGLQEYGEIITLLGTEPKYDDRKYTPLGELTTDAANPEILCVVRDPKFRGFSDINSYTFANISDPEFMADIVLGNNHSSYNRSIDIYRTVVFTNINNLYRIYGDGYMKYNYTSTSTGSDKKDITASFSKASAFITAIYSHLPTEAEIYLSGIETKENGIYEFKFDYIIGDIPVVINYNNPQLGAMNNAIVIKANSIRVLECAWLIKYFESSKKYMQYDMLLDNISPDFKWSNLPKVQDIFTAYVLTSEEDTGTISPSWVIEYTNTESMVIPMKLKGAAD